MGVYEMVSDFLVGRLGEYGLFPEERDSHSFGGGRIVLFVTGSSANFFKKNLVTCIKTGYIVIEKPFLFLWFSVKEKAELGDIILAFPPHPAKFLLGR